jgi:hypothetical protein
LLKIKTTKKDCGWGNRERRKIRKRMLIVDRSRVEMAEGIG